MKFSIKTEYPGRLRVKLIGPVPPEDLGALEAVLAASPAIAKARVYPRIGEIAVSYGRAADARKRVLAYLCAIDAAMIDDKREGHSLSTSAHTHQLLMDLAVLAGSYLARRLLLPQPISFVLNLWAYRRFLGEALRSLSRRRLDVPVLDATAIGMSFVKGDPKTAGETMFLLNLGETLEDYTKARSESALIDALLDVSDTAQLVEGDTETEVRVASLEPGNVIAIRTGRAG